MPKWRVVAYGDVVIRPARTRLDTIVVMADRIVSIAGVPFENIPRVQRGLSLGSPAMVWCPNAKGKEDFEIERLDNA